MKVRVITQNIITASLGATIALGGFYLNNHNSENTTITPIISEVKPNIQLSNSPTPQTSPVASFEKAAQQSVNSVVHIKTYARRGNNQQSQDHLQDLFFGRPQKMPKIEITGSGSGVIISKDGYIATNNHVVKDATKIEVTLNDKRTYNGTIIGTDPTTDLALIKIDEDKLAPIFYGNSDNVNVGEWVLAVGNPFNLNSTVTAGIVSAKGRNINILKEEYAIESFIQTDAAVNPGNSGGALVNRKGELIGINTAIASNTGSYTGYSFAVPVNMVKKIMSDLAKHGTVQRALLGVQIRELNADLAKDQKISNLKGVYISRVMEGSSASDGGIKDGDIIRSINGIKISSSAELQERIGQYRPGDAITIEIERDKKRINSKLTLKNKLGTMESMVKKLSFLGADFGVVSKKQIKELKISGGARIDGLTDGKLLREGIKKGFIITKLNHENINSPKEFIEIIKNLKGGVLIEGLYPSGSKAYYGFGM